MKREVLRAGRAVDAWVTQTQCLGICPKKGATVAIYPQQHIWSEVEVADVPALLGPALAGTGTRRDR
jgi:(2Fe-2S) ferredoxin